MQSDARDVICGAAVVERVLTDGHGDDAGHHFTTGVVYDTEDAPGSEADGGAAAAAASAATRWTSSPSCGPFAGRGEGPALAWRIWGRGPPWR